MDSHFTPENAAQVEEAVRWAISEKVPLDVIGSGSKRAIGQPVQAHATLDVAKLSGITLYEPEELVLSAKAGTPRSLIERALAAKNQEMAFEPPDYGALLASGHAGTIGGMIACNLAGPRRIKQGAARDHFLGFHAVSGRGEQFQSGARVVKNVTGYDLPKILAGSFGTLAVMSDVTIKVLPAAETQTTLLLQGLDAETACRAMSAAMQSSSDVSAAAYLPEEITALSGVVALSRLGTSATLLRLEGVEPSVDFRVARLTSLLKDFALPQSLAAAISKWIWADIRDVRYFAGDQTRLIWKLSVPPMEGGRILSELSSSLELQGFLDWAGGLIWLSLPVSEHAGAQLIRGALASCGGHATLMRAPMDVRSSIPVFHPQDPVMSALTQRLKNAFDPEGVLNPGRMSFKA